MNVLTLNNKEYCNNCHKEKLHLIQNIDALPVLLPFSIRIRNSVTSEDNVFRIPKEMSYTRTPV